MKTRHWLPLLVLLCISTAALADGPEPAPWWQQVEQTQSLALKWLAALTVIGGALATFIAFLVGKIYEIKSSVEANQARIDGQQQQIHSIALSTPAPAPQQPPATAPSTAAQIGAK